jgi:NAD(P)-dependent dehydrogenase (short-subunit alcohol dehydrogenase family)
MNSYREKMHRNSQSSLNIRFPRFSGRATLALCAAHSSISRNASMEDCLYAISTAWLDFPETLAQSAVRNDPLSNRTKLAQIRRNTTMTQTFGAESTTDEVLAGIDLNGKRVLVTGVSAGIGVETVRVLASHGAQVVGAARDLNKARKATAGIPLELVELDLASLASARACADALLAKGDKFDLVIANAGVMACPKSATKDGFETQFGTNHLGHFVFINRILKLFKPVSRLVNLSSAGHAIADVDLEDPNFERTPYTAFAAYGRSKTANILFAVEFDRRHKSAGIRAAAVHPGVIETELSRHMTPKVLQELHSSMPAIQTDTSAPRQSKTIPQGAATSVWAGITATAEQIGGRYCEDCHVAEISEGPGFRGGVHSYALNPEHAKALWAKSEEMVGEKF